MELFTKPFGAWLIFVYHCFDRIVLSGYLMGLQRPGQVVYWLQPTAQNALDGAMGGVIALVTSLWGLPEDAPMLPLAYKTLTGVGTGVARRSLSHAVQKGFVYLTSYHSCLAASGLAAPYNPYALS